MQPPTLITGDFQEQLAGLLMTTESVEDQPFRPGTEFLCGITDQQDAWLTGLREACHFFGGVPQEVLFDNTITIILERDAYGEGNHRWHPALLAVAEELGFRPRVCRPYRAQTKGKVKRFNGYLKRSFVTPLAATLKQAGLMLDLTPRCQDSCRLTGSI